MRRVARAGWSRRWWCIPAVAAQRAVCSTVLARWMSPPLPAGGEGPLLGDVLCLEEPSACEGVSAGRPARRFTLGVALKRRYPELQSAGPHRLVVLPCEVKGKK